MASPTLTNEARRQAFLDPVRFQQTVFRRKLWGVQQRILRAIETKRHVAVKGCHASGKTFAASGAVPWWLSRYRRGKVFTIAPTLRQVKLMWSEIAIALANSQVRFPEPSTTGLKFSDERYALGISSSRGVNIQGPHGEDVLIIVDEAPGVHEDMYDAIEGIRAGGHVTLLELGNPTVPSGNFHGNFTRGRSSCECITISAFDSPNLAGLTIEQLLKLPEHELDLAPWPFLTQRRWVKERYERWGPTNPRYVSRVLGEFPSQSDYAVFDLAWIERARREPSKEELEHARRQGSYIQVGIDVAAGGDAETTACARVNGIILARAAWSQAEAPISRWLGNLMKTGFPLGFVVMDAVGVGFHLARALAEDFKVYGFKAGGEAIDKEQYLNAKAEAYFRLREMYQGDYISHMPEALDEETEAQLSTIEFRERLRGQIMIEPKEDARKRGVPSPDRAEAEIMAFCQIVQAGAPFQVSSWQSISPV